jgi:hypothetical protein
MCPMGRWAQMRRATHGGRRADVRRAPLCAPDRHVADAMTASSSRHSATLARSAARRYCAQGVSTQGVCPAESGMAPSIWPERASPGR